MYTNHSAKVSTIRAGTFVAIVVALLLPMLSGCTVVRAQVHSITLVATATAAESRPSLTESVRSDLVNLAKASKKPGQATVRLITSPDGEIISKDLTPVRANGDIQHAIADANRQIDASINDLAEQVRNTTASTAGLGLLPLLDRASQLPDSNLHVLSSGATTDDPTAFQQLGFGIDVVKIVDGIEQRGGLPNLSGHHVTFHGLGTSGGSQPRFQPFERQVIETFWLAICQRAHADSCTVAKDEPLTEPPIATLPVALIPVATIKTEGGCPVWQRLSDSTLHFAPNSAVLGVDADAVLIEVVADVRSCHLQVNVAGHVADTGSGDAPDLSGQRARAVANRLVALGLPLSSLGAVEGHGTSEPVIVNFTDGQFDESKAQLNRRVELTFTRGEAR